MAHRQRSSMRAVVCVLAIGLCLAMSLAGCSLGVKPKPPHATIYVTTQEEAISAIDAATGAIRWTFRGGGMLVMALSGDTLYAASSAGDVYALDARDGHIRWQRKDDSRAFFTSCVVSGDTLYTTANVYGATGFAPGVYAFDASTGALRWRVDARGFIVGGMSMAANHLYYATVATDSGSGATTVYALRADDGATTWRATIAAGVRWPLSADTSQIYVSSMDGAVEALGASDGALRWRRVISPAGEPLSTVAPNGQTLYVGDGRGDVYALRTRDGSQVWKRAFPNTATDPGTMVYTPSVVGGAIYLSSVYSSDIYALRSSDGSTLWRYDTLGYTNGQSPVVTPSGMYTISGPYAVDILNAGSGSAIATYSYASQHELIGMESLIVGPPLTVS